MVHTLPFGDSYVGNTGRIIDADDALDDPAADIDLPAIAPSIVRSVVTLNVCTIAVN